MLLHWVMAFLLIGLFSMGLYMTGLDYYDPLYHGLPQWHKFFGVITFILLLVRFIWKLKNMNPVALTTHKEYERMLSYYIKNIFYALIFVIAVTGYFISTAKGKALELFFGIKIPAITKITDQSMADLIGDAHFWVAILLVVLVVLHAAAALKHHFVDKDNTLKRMLHK